MVEGITEITLYTLFGSPSPSTMRVWGKINNQEMIILTDSGNTYNFLDVYVWLPLSAEDSFEVKVANTTILRAKRACQKSSFEDTRH